jgi:hypothetical protein
MKSRQIEEEKSQNGCGEEAEKVKKKQERRYPFNLGSYIFFHYVLYRTAFRKTFIPTRHAVK